MHNAPITVNTIQTQDIRNKSTIHITIFSACVYNIRNPSNTLTIQYWLDLFRMFYINKGLIFSCFVYFLCGATQYVFWAQQTVLHTTIYAYTHQTITMRASPFAVGVEWAIERDHITDIGKSFFYYTDTRQ